VLLLLLVVHATAPNQQMLGLQTLQLVLALLLLLLLVVATADYQQMPGQQLLLLVQVLLPDLLLQHALLLLLHAAAC
jgi:hypothetical protein